MLSLTPDGPEPEMTLRTEAEVSADANPDATMAAGDIGVMLQDEAVELPHSTLAHLHDPRRVGHSAGLVQ